MTQYRNTTKLTIGNVKLEDSGLFSDPGLYPSTVHYTSLQFSIATANTGPKAHKTTQLLPLSSLGSLWILSLSLDFHAFGRVGNLLW